MNSEINILDESFPSGKESRLDIIDLIVKKINSSGIIPSIEGDEMYLLIDEALTNAMEHGNKWDPLKKVYIKVFRRSGFLIISIQDEGSGFDLKIALDNNEDRLALRGRGIMIINAFSEASWNNMGNCITLKLELRRNR